MGCRSSKISTPPSTVLQCPTDGNPEDFRKICRLFDRLDADSNLGVCIAELQDVAELHVQNRIRHLTDQKTFKSQQREADLARLQREENARIDDIRADFVQKKTALQEQNRREADRLAAEVDRLETLNPAGKSAEFMTVLKPKDSEYIDFWCFYDYMRTRVRDMDNIRHRDEEK